MGGAFIKILEDKYQIQQTIKNLGLREAKNSRATMYIMKLLDTGIHLQLHTPPSTSKSGATSIGPNESIPISSRFNLNADPKVAFDSSYLAVKLEYIDPLYKSEIKKNFIGQIIFLNKNSYGVLSGDEDIEKKN